MANGTRGTVTAVDADQRTLTLRVDGDHGREVTLPGWYLDGEQRWGWHEDDQRRTVDLAYATTGHKAQGLTRWRALVRLTGREDSNWLYVQLSRAKDATTIYAQVGPEPHASEVGDLPEVDLPDGYEQLAQAIGRDGAQQLAIDTTARLDLRRLPTRELRDERDRLAQLLDQAPEDQTRVLARALRRREDAERVLTDATARREALAARVAAMLGSRLRFRVSQDARNWQRGARGERRTARQLRRLTHHGWVVLHDLAIPGSGANADHLAIGPSGLFLLDSKNWSGRLAFTPDGTLWHGSYPLTATLATIAWEASAIADTLTIPACSIQPMMVIHGSTIPWGEQYLGGVAILPAGRLVATLLALPPLLTNQQVADLAGRAVARLRPAA